MQRVRSVSYGAGKLKLTLEVTQYFITCIQWQMCQWNTSWEKNSFQDNLWNNFRHSLTPVSYIYCDILIYFVYYAKHITRLKIKAKKSARLKKKKKKPSSEHTFLEKKIPNSVIKLVNRGHFKHLLIIADLRKMWERFYN